MRIVSCDGFFAHCEALGISRKVNLFLLQHEELRPGDHVMVHVGYAIQRIEEVEARSIWVLYDEALAAQDKRPSDA